MADDNKEKTAIEKERESIPVTTLEPKETEEKVETKEAEGETEEKEEVEENKEEIEAKSDEIENLEGQKEGASEKEKARIQRRIDKLTKDKSDLKAENENLKRQLAARPDDEKVLTEDEVERRSETKAQQKALQKQFEANCDKLHDGAIKIDKEFDKRVKAMADDIGFIPTPMIDVLSELPNGSAVLVHLTKNIDDAEDIYKLSPTKMALRLSKISETLVAKSKKEISKVPPAKEKVGGSGQTPDVITDNMSMEEFARVRAKQVEERRKLKLGLH